MNAGAAVTGPTRRHHRAGKLKHLLFKNQIHFHTSFVFLFSFLQTIFENKQRRGLDLAFKFRKFFQQKEKKDEQNRTKKQKLPLFKSEKKTIQNGKLLEKARSG